MQRFRFTWWLNGFFCSLARWWRGKTDKTRLWTLIMIPALGSRESFTPNYNFTFNWTNLQTEGGLPVDTHTPMVVVGGTDFECKLPGVGGGGKRATRWPESQEHRHWWWYHSESLIFKPIIVHYVSWWCKCISAWEAWKETRRMNPMTTLIDPELNRTRLDFQSFDSILVGDNWKHEARYKKKKNLNRVLNNHANHRSIGRYNRFSWPSLGHTSDNHSIWNQFQARMKIFSSSKRWFNWFI